MVHDFFELLGRPRSLNSCTRPLPITLHSAHMRCNKGCALTPNATTASLGLYTACMDSASTLKMTRSTCNNLCQHGSLCATLDRDVEACGELCNSRFIVAWGPSAWCSSAPPSESRTNLHNMSGKSLRSATPVAKRRRSSVCAPSRKRFEIRCAAACSGGVNATQIAEHLSRCVARHSHLRGRRRPTRAATRCDMSPLHGCAPPCAVGRTQSIARPPPVRMRTDRRCG